MEKKQTNTYSGISKSVLKNLNRNFVSEPLKDENRISEIMSEFIGGELNTIYSILNSNEILNFKDQSNQTLIHAILRNELPNVTEENKLDIIQKLSSVKNVSLNTMTNYNQNPLHLACQKGYGLIITYLIEKKCDQTLVDNYGNAPIHYLIYKFIRDCEDNDYYNQTNKQIKLMNSFDIKKINNIIKNQSLFLLNDKTNNNPIMDAMKTFISNKIQSSLPLLYELIDKKTIEINKIFIDLNESEDNKFEKAKKIIFGINNDIFQIYGLDLDFTNIIWNNFLDEQKIRIDNKKKKIMENIMSVIDKIINYINQDIIDIIKRNIIYPFTKFTAGTFLMLYLVYKMINGNVNLLINDENGDIVNPIHHPVNLNNITMEGKYFNDGEYDDGDDDRVKYVKYVKRISEIFFKKNLMVFLNGLNQLDTNNINQHLISFNNLDKINILSCNFNIKEDGYKFCYNNNIICEDHILMHNDAHHIYIPQQTNIGDIGDILLHHNIDKHLNLNEIKQIFNTIHHNEDNNDKYYIFSPILMIIEYIFSIYENVIISKLNDFKNKNNYAEKIHKFCLFDIKYLSENIFKIINNLVILEKYYDDINIDEILNNINEFYKSIKFEGNMQPDIFDYVKNQTFINELKSVDFDFLYDKNTNILDYFNELIKHINEYFSYEQLEKYNELLKMKFDNVVKNIDIKNTILNNYSFSLKYPPKYKQYKNTYFKLKNDNINDIVNHVVNDDLDDGDNIENYILDNNDYIKLFYNNIWKYDNTIDFNIFYFEYDTIDYNIIKIYNNNVAVAVPPYNINFEPKQYDINRTNKFNRGYDIINDIINEHTPDTLELKTEKHILCNMELIKDNSDMNGEEVKESDNKTVVWAMKDKVSINDIVIKEPYIITNNLSELINMLVYFLCEFIIKNDDIVDSFFNTDYLDNYNIDDASKKNIRNTLQFIKKNDDEKKQYLYDNIKSYVKIFLYKEMNEQIFKIMEEIKINDTNIKKIEANYFNEKLVKLNNNYKIYFWNNNYAELIKNLQPNGILEIQELLNFSSDKSSDIKILNSKCLNKKK